MREVKLGSVAIVLVLLVACGVSEESFPKEYARAICSYADKCEKSLYNEAYDGRADCRDEIADDFDFDEDIYDHCDFDPKKARECIDSIEKAARNCDYDDIDDDCEEIWECDSGGGGNRSGGSGNSTG